MTLKQKIYNHYLQEVNDKVKSLQQVLADLKESGSNETKSSAGDKYETTLAMLQLEQANVLGLLDEALKQKVALQLINPAITTKIIVNGSLIKTNRGYLFMSLALGKAIIGDNAVMALSPLSPLGKKLMGLKVGGNVEVNNIMYIIKGIE